jgi:hypothetical protein
MSTRQANILDPIHDALDERVWDNPAEDQPTLKPEHRQWILDKVHQVLTDAGYHGMEDWLGLVFTGSLTTYQYSDESDVDISLFVNVETFPEWDRAGMIGTMVEHVDGTTLPGTPHPMQCFVVPEGVTREMLYQPGLRSGYDLDADQWVIPPDKSRVHDVQKEMYGSYAYALECADKMERLLQYDPDKAVMFWHQIHKRRRRDQVLGKGDYSESNIAYKMLANRGLFPKISDVSGEYIARENSASKFQGAIPLAKSGKAHVIFQDFKPSVDHRGNELPWIYDPAANTVYLGPAKAFHWQLIRKIPQLSEQYPGEGWNGAPFLQNANHIHGRMSWPDLNVIFYGSPTPEQKQEILEGLSLPNKQATEAPTEDWDF